MSANVKEIDVNFHVTPQATQHMAKYFEGKEISPVRIFYHSGG
ncbi:MAG: hypothetical protein PVJ84_08325 [Desulfobacteraceae bacterium]|jgi:hypothetical protein